MEDRSLSSPKAPPLVLRMIKARPRLLLSAVVGILTVLVLQRVSDLPRIACIIVGWNAGACLYLALAGRMIVSSSHERMRARALEEDEGRLTVLALVVAAAVMCLGAIVAELATAQDMAGAERSAHIGLAVLTIVSSWAFTQVMFALHYAHDYYSAVAHGHPGGLDFPHESAPDYGDFLYFAFIIGTSAQTADVSLTSRVMRRTGLVHCVLAFFFNTTLLALTINIASGLF